MEWILFLAVYIIGSLLSYGYTFAYFQRKYSELADETYSEDVSFALLVSLGSYIGLLAGLLATGFSFKYGFKFY